MAALGAWLWRADPSIVLAAEAHAPAAVASAVSARASGPAVHTPMHFEARTASNGAPLYEAQGLGYGVVVSAGGARLSLPAPGAPPAEVTFTIDGALGDATMSGTARLPGVVHRYVGARADWATAIATYARVDVAGVRPGVDVTYYGNQEQLEYDFVIAPGTSPDQAAMIVKGADSMELTSDGDLLIQVGTRTLRQRRPVAYQTRDGRHETVPASFTYQPATHRVGFAVGAYDPRLPLVIDPVLVYSSRFGGTGTEAFVSVALDANAFIYVLGYASQDGYPTSPGAFQAVKPGAANTIDYVITKFNPAGTAVIYSTYLGGTADEYSNTFNMPGDIAVDSTGQVHIAGDTRSTDFPVTAGRCSRRTMAARSTRSTCGSARMAHSATRPISAAPTPIRRSVSRSTRPAPATCSAPPTRTSPSSFRSPPTPSRPT